MASENGSMNRQRAGEIIPQAAQDILVQFGEGMSRNTWAVGDLALELCTERFEIPKAVIDAACGVFARLSAARVADMRAVSEYYPRDICFDCGGALQPGTRFCGYCRKPSQDVRERYDVCSFSHFQAAKSAGTYTAALEWLDLCERTIDDFGGVVMPVDKLRALMSKDGANEDTPVYQKRVNLVQRTLEKLANDPETPQEYVALAGQLLAVYYAEVAKLHEITESGADVVDATTAGETAEVAVAQP